MEQLTTLDELRRQIGALACIDETEAPFVSCYLNLEQGGAGYRMALALPSHDGEANRCFRASVMAEQAELSYMKELSETSALAQRPSRRGAARW